MYIKPSCAKINITDKVVWSSSAVQRCQSCCNAKCNARIHWDDSTTNNSVFYSLSDGKINDSNFGWRKNNKIIKPKVNNKQIYELQECWDKKIALTFQLHCNKFTTHYIYVKEIIAIFSSKNFNSFYPIVPFYNPWKSLKAFGFLRILGDIEMKHWAKMG